jgi:DNA repair protein SbcD/Mre11
LRILHTSDWHLGRALENVSRLEEQKEFLEQLFQICDSENIQMVLIAGDIFDTYNPSAKAQELFCAALERLSDNGKRAVVVIAGNHDNPDRLCAIAPLVYKRGIFMSGYPGEDVESKMREETKEDFSWEGARLLRSGPGFMEVLVPGCAHAALVVCLPYPSEARLKEVLSQNASEEVMQKAYSQRVGEFLQNLCQEFRSDTVNLMIAHLFILGGKESESERTLQVGGALTVSAEKLPANAHYIALGHLHRPQKIANAPSPTYYAGSPLAYSFSESDYSKAVYVIEAEPGMPALIQERVLDARKPLKRWKAKSIEEALDWVEKGKDQNAWVDLEIHVDRVLKEEEQRQLRRFHPGIINIRPILKTDPSKQRELISREGRKLEELVFDFYKTKRGVEPDLELLQTLMEILGENE